MTKLSVEKRILLARRDAKLNQQELANSIGISARTLIRWEKGGKPNLEDLKKIAQATRKPLSYFISNDEENKDDGKLPLNKPESIPVISWENANQFNNVDDPFPIGCAIEYLKCNHDGEAVFALKVDDDNMSVEFNPGDIIVVNPHISYAPDDYVVVKDAASKSAIFRQYKQFGETSILHPLNPKYQDIVMENRKRYTIIGKIVEKTKNYLQHGRAAQENSRR